MDDANTRPSGNLLGFAKPALQVAGCLVVLLLFRSCVVGFSNWMNKPDGPRQQPQAAALEPEPPREIQSPPRAERMAPPVLEANPTPEPDKPKRPQSMDKMLTATPDKWSEPFFVPLGWGFNLRPEQPLKVRVNGGDPLSGMLGYFNGYRWEGRDSEERPTGFGWPSRVESIEFESPDSAQRVQLPLDARRSDAVSLEQWEKQEHTLVRIPPGQFVKVPVNGRNFNFEVEGSESMKVRIRLNRSRGSKTLDAKTPGQLGVRAGTLYAIDADGERAELDQGGAVQSVEFQSLSGDIRAVVVHFE